MTFVVVYFNSGGCMCNFFTETIYSEKKKWEILDNVENRSKKKKFDKITHGGAHTGLLIFNWPKEG